MPILGIIASANQQGRGGGPVGAYDSLATVTVPSGGLASVTFAGIPSGYKHLQLRATMLGSTTGVDSPYIRFNGDTGSNYSWHSLLGEGTTARAQAVANTSSINMGGMWFGLVGSYPSVAIVDVLDYQNTNKYKTARVLTGQDNNSTYGSVGLESGLWQNTSAINSLTVFLSGSTTFSQYSSFALYGVK